MNRTAFINKKTEESFEKLKTGKYEEKQLYEFIERARQDLGRNPQAGIRIPKHIWFQKFISRDMELIISGNITYLMHGVCSTQ